MSESNLVLHRGAVEVSRTALAAVEAPPPSGRWFPLKHDKVLETVSSTLEAAGFRVTRERVALARDSHRLFATLDLDAPLAAGVALAAGVRNSTDKSFPLGFCAGNRVFVCDNLAFRSELLVRKKHTKFGEERFTNAIAGAIQSLRSFQDTEKRRIVVMRETALTDEAASHLVLKALEQAIVTPLVVSRVWRAWRKPEHDYGPPSLWRLLNSFTEVLAVRAKRAPAEYAGQTLRLNALLTPEVTDGQTAA